MLREFATATAIAAALTGSSALTVAPPSHPAVVRSADTDSAVTAWKVFAADPDTAGLYDSRYKVDYMGVLPFRETQSVDYAFVGEPVDAPHDATLDPDQLYYMFRISMR